jgi:hypothetical protein
VSGRRDGCGDGSGREPIEQYLSELRARLRGRDAGLILAEAEDHLREDVAAGLAAGLTAAEAQHAAISSFGSVRSVVRAHQPRWRRAVAGLSRPALALSQLAGLFLVAFNAASLAGLAVLEVRLDFVLPAVAIISHVVPGLTGLAVLYVSRRARRRWGARITPARAASPVRFAAGAALLYAFIAVALTAFGVAGAIPLIWMIIFACGVLALGFAIRLGTLSRRGSTG